MTRHNMMDIEKQAELLMMKKEIIKIIHTYPEEKAIIAMLDLLNQNQNMLSYFKETHGDNDKYAQMRDNFNSSKQNYQAIQAENKELKETINQYKNIIEENKLLKEQIKQLKSENKDLKQLPVNKVIEEEYLDIVNNMQNVAQLFTNYTNSISDFKRKMNAFKYYEQFEKLIYLLKTVNNYIEYNHQNGKTEINKYLNALKIELINIIASFKIEEINVNYGDDFKSEFHQTEKPTNYATKIKKCKQPGYMYEGKVLCKAEVEVFEESEVK